ncbi:hypothetical protein F7018_01015 [Tenacibaculum aiptasiae]|uniref:TonB C-terminal domain-containing protein n=1 Tax=Tenacibaculum aiptasiae TaxID=426481 RepID=A0A7J5AS73_9FLAO|nr:hypothetical protein [Tenacibaculum aiptasiae]KAB1160487.1 hypothetical protein F7018_01015 [Tenacibaculum aiptasiae]
MKNKLLIFLLFFTISIQAQFEFQPDTTEVSCKKELDKAEKDFNQNNFTLRIQKTPWLTDTQIRIIKEYGIKIESSRFHMNNCYDYKIEKLLNKKFGFNFLKHTEEKAKYLDENGKGNRSASLINKEKDLKSHILNNLSKKQLRILRKKYGQKNIWIASIIDKKGYYHIQKIGFLTEFDIESFDKSLNQIEEISEPLISNIIDNKLLYIPATKNGELVIERIIYRMNFKK